MSQNKEIKTVALVVKKGSARAADYANDVCNWLITNNIKVILLNDCQDIDLPEEVTIETKTEIQQNADMLFSLGGDGTLIETVKTVSIADIPILGVNLGNKGFLTELSPEELYQKLPEVIKGNYFTEDRFRLAVKHIPKSSENGEPPIQLAVNDLVFIKGARSKMPLLQLYIDDIPVTVYRGDGLIVSSPTGSTAYSMSAGGPILHPSQKTMLITPICPYTLTQRPFVVPSHLKIKLELITEHRNVFTTIDGRDARKIEYNDIIEISVHEKPFRLVKVSGRSFYEVLKMKLSWGYDPPYDKIES